MSDEGMETASWSEYRLYLVKALEGLEKLIKELESKIDALRREGIVDINTLRAEVNALKVDFAMQKVKVGLIGSVAGAVISALISYLMKGH